MRARRGSVYGATWKGNGWSACGCRTLAGNAGGGSWRWITTMMDGLILWLLARRAVEQKFVCSEIWGARAGGRHQGCASRCREVESAAGDRGCGFAGKRQRGSGGDATGRRACGSAERRREQTQLDAYRPQGTQRQQERDWHQG